MTKVEVKEGKGLQGEEDTGGGGESPLEILIVSLNLLAMMVFGVNTSPGPKVQFLRL